VRHLLLRVAAVERGTGAMTVLTPTFLSLARRLLVLPTISASCFIIM
jgi:hypothetical protein